MWFVRMKRAWPKDVSLTIYYLLIELVLHFLVALDFFFNKQLVNMKSRLWMRNNYAAFGIKPRAVSNWLETVYKGAL